jgi:chemotaxis protein MotB
MSGNGPTIIIKKRVEGEEEHHGGVWKLAFADFMTAMMAFFLVMWLINSTSKETKEVIVQYFNPVQLVDTTKAHQGLRDPGNGEGKSASVETSAGKPGAGPKDVEAALQSEPLKTLDAIARQEPAPASDAGAPRDPFDRPKKAQSHEDSAAASAETSRETAHVKAEQGAAPDKGKIVGELQAAIEKIAAKETVAPRVEVKQTDEGLLISLTDDTKFSMFDVGSIKPKPQLVRIIGEIGKTLAARRGQVELRGHTDGRSYANKSYDNWRLSSDRATMTNYMLVRGGLPAARIDRVVGLADRHLKTPKDPLSPVNRRIEILLRGAEP